MNITWSEAQNSEDQASLNVLEHWDGANTNIYVTLVIFIVLKVLIENISGVQGFKNLTFMFFSSICQSDKNKTSG